MPSKLRVQELFYTIQGEGSLTGTPAAFIRLQGCDVGCPWCDTKHTWDFDGEANDLSESEIVDEVERLGARHVVITGGEPCAQEIWHLTAMLEERGISTQIETSGTYLVDVDNRTWVTVSPKYNMPGGRPVLDQAIQRANEIKLVVGKPADLEHAHGLYDQTTEAYIWLQPLSESPKATELCIEACKEHDYKLSVQVHKLIGVP